MNFKEYMIEGQLNKNADVVADIFARFLIGDSKAAVNQLSKLVGKDVGAVINTDSEEYNKQYDKLREKLLKAMKSELT